MIKRRPDLTPAAALALLHWWVVLLFLINLSGHVSAAFAGGSFFTDFGSLMHPGVPFGLLVIGVGILYALERHHIFWHKLKPLAKYAILVGAYSVNMVLSLFVVGVVITPISGPDYYDSCAAGSPLMLAIPSAVFYAVVGGLITLVMSVRSMSRAKRNVRRRENTAVPRGAMRD